MPSYLVSNDHMPPVTRDCRYFFLYCRQQGHAGSKTLQQRNPPVLNWRCRLTQVDLYNGRKTGGWLVLYSRLRQLYVVCVP